MKRDNPAPDWLPLGSFLRPFQYKSLFSHSGISYWDAPDLQVTLDDYGLYQHRSQVIDWEPDSRLDSISRPWRDETQIAESLFSKQPGVDFDPTVGYSLALMGGFAKEGSYRANGSSGGLTTWLLAELLNRGEINGVIHLTRSGGGKAPLFEYSLSVTPEEIQENSKTRYYPGELSSILKNLLGFEGRVAIVAIPSFATEIRLLCETNPDFNARIAFVFGLVCGHQKTANYALALANEQGIPASQLIDIDFRKKTDIGSSDRYMTEFTYLSEGTIRKKSSEATDSFVGNWGMGFFKVPFSDFSDDVFNETADVVFGDAWLPEFQSDPNGTNIVIVRNARLQSILEEAHLAGRVHLQELSLSEIVQSQSALVRHGRSDVAYRTKKMKTQGPRRFSPRDQYSVKPTLIRKKIQDVRFWIMSDSHKKFVESMHNGSWSSFRTSMLTAVFVYRTLYFTQRVMSKVARTFSRFSWRAK